MTLSSDDEEGKRLPPHLSGRWPEWLMTGRTWEETRHEARYLHWAVGKVAIRLRTRWRIRLEVVQQRNEELINENDELRRLLQDARMCR